MAWTIRFQPLYDDVVEAFFADVVLKDAADVARWEREVVAALSTYPKKVRLLINLDGLVVKPSAASSFGETRARVLEKHAVASTRYGGDAWTQMSINTSAARHGAHANVFASRDAALKALLASDTHH